MSGVFSELVSYFRDERYCLYKPENGLRFGQLRSAAVQLRTRLGFNSKSRLALCGLSPDELATVIMAFDGFVDAMLFLPAGLDQETCSMLIESARCTCRFDSLREAPEALVQKNSIVAEQPGIETRWILATSGTTGVPKLVEHTLATLSRTVKRDHVRGAEYVWGLLYDPCRYAGLQVMLQSMLSGSRLSIPMAGGITAQIKSFASDGVNALSATPSLWRKLIMADGIGELSLRQITVGGETADQMILDALRYRFPDARIVHIYASTEGGTAFAVHDGRAGFPAEWIGNDSFPVGLKVGDDGHLLIRSDKFPSGNEVIQRIDAEGYLDTQDLVRIENGRVYFIGRASGAINVGGNKVNPEEVENLIRQVDGVIDVRILGKKSSMLGQLVAAEVVAEAGMDKQELKRSLLHHCRSQLQSWQVPAFISFVPELTVTAAGKRERSL